MDFREVTAALLGAVLESHSIDLAAGRVELVPVERGHSAAGRRTVAFESVSAFKWTATTPRGRELFVSIIGLERLGPEEPWRLYLRSENGGELELTCARVSFGGAEVAGVGRSYRH